MCVNPRSLNFCSKKLSGKKSLLVAVVGFPLGANLTDIKIFETKECLQLGAKEIDMVLPIGELKAGELEKVFNDIRGVVTACSPYPVKVILETGLLTQEEKILACVLSKFARARFVKTSTGFSIGGATVEDVRLMKTCVGDALEVKASGGVKDFKTACDMIAAGATRIGTSSGPVIVSGGVAKGSY